MIQAATRDETIPLLLDLQDLERKRLALLDEIDDLQDAPPRETVHFRQDLHHTVAPRG